MNPQFNSLLSVVNSTASAKAVKVRFLEGKDSREVLDFNLYLSHNDVWTAGIIPTADGARHRHVRQVVYGAGGVEHRFEPDAVRQLRVQRRRIRTARTPRSTARVKATSKSSRWAT